MLPLRPRGLIGRHSLLRRHALGLRLRLHLGGAFGCGALFLCSPNLRRTIFGGTGLQCIRLRGTLLLCLGCLLLRRTLLDQVCLIRRKAADCWSIPFRRCRRMHEAIAATSHRWRSCGRQRPAGIAADGRRLHRRRPAHRRRHDAGIRVGAWCRRTTLTHSRHLRRTSCARTCGEACRWQFARPHGHRACRQHRLSCDGTRRAHRTIGHRMRSDWLRCTGRARRDQPHMWRQWLAVGAILLQLPQLRHGDRGTAPAGDHFFARRERHRRRWRRSTGYHRTRECPARIACRLNLQLAAKAGQTRRHVRGRLDVGLDQRPRLDRQHGRGNCARAREHVLRHHRHRLRRGAVRIVDVLRSVRIVVAGVVVVDDRVVDDGIVDHPDIGHVDVVEIIARDLVWRQVHVVRSEWKPADRFAVADAERDAQARPAKKRDQRRRIHRALLLLTGNPAPAILHVHPATVVVGREAPLGVVDPGPAIRIDPFPATIAIRRPIRRDVGRIPDFAVIRARLPVAVRVQIVVTDHIGGDIASRWRAHVAAVAGEAEAVEAVGRG